MSDRQQQNEITVKLSREMALAMKRVVAEIKSERRRIQRLVTEFRRMVTTGKPVRFKGNGHARAS